MCLRGGPVVRFFVQMEISGRRCLLQVLVYNLFRETRFRASTLYQIPRKMRLSFGAVAVLAFGSTCQVVSADGAFAVACGLRAPCRGSDQRPALDCSVGWGYGQGSVRDLAYVCRREMSLIFIPYVCSLCNTLTAGCRKR